MTIKNYLCNFNNCKDLKHWLNQVLINRYFPIIPTSLLLIFSSSLWLFDFPRLTIGVQVLAQTVTNREAEANRLYQQGDQLVKLGKFKAALSVFEKTLAIYQEIGDRHSAGLTLNYLGIVNRSMSRYPQALESYQQALAIFKEFSDRLNEGTTLSNIGLIYDNTGQYSQAINFYEKALAIRREVGDRFGEGYTLNALGLVYQ